MHPTEEKHALFAALAAEAAACRRCETMCGRAAVLSERNGRPEARVMFIGEAPGRQGGDRTRVPFSGDQSGHNFGRYIASINLAREDIFITNSVLCNPRKESGANRKPSVKESLNCAGFLRRQIELVAPRVVVTLGAVALVALGRIEYHQFTLKDSAGRVCEWNGRLLVPLYHPSPQVLASHRREDAQLRDYTAVARAIRQSGEKSHAGAQSRERPAGRIFGEA
ncbi:MAG TPA: uracil-DNA glycosylase [Pyrinomonadaceae bacterium]|jgi:DNA polymerase